MNIRIRIVDDFNVDETKVRKMIEFATKFLRIEDVSANVEINWHNSENASGYLKISRDDGYHVPTVRVNLPREFEYDVLAVVLFHEMTHLQQHAQNRLPLVYNRPSAKEYWSSLHETEARTISELMLGLYAKKNVMSEGWIERTRERMAHENDMIQYHVHGIVPENPTRPHLWIKIDPVIKRMMDLYVGKQLAKEIIG